MLGIGLLSHHSLSTICKTLICSICLNLSNIQSSHELISDVVFLTAQRIHLITHHLCVSLCLTLLCLLLLVFGSVFGGSSYNSIMWIGRACLLHNCATKKFQGRQKENTKMSELSSPKSVTVCCGCETIFPDPSSVQECPCLCVCVCMRQSYAVHVTEIRRESCERAGMMHTATRPWNKCSALQLKRTLMHPFSVELAAGTYTCTCM